MEQIFIGDFRFKVLQRRLVSAPLKYDQNAKRERSTAQDTVAEYWGRGVSCKKSFNALHTTRFHGVPWCMLPSTFGVPLKQRYTDHPHAESVATTTIARCKSAQPRKGGGSLMIKKIETFTQLNGGFLPQCCAVLFVLAEVFLSRPACKEPSLKRIQHTSRSPSLKGTPNTPNGAPRCKELNTRHGHPYLRWVFNFGELQYPSQRNSFRTYSRIGPLWAAGHFVQAKIDAFRESTATAAVHANLRQTREGRGSQNCKNKWG